MRLLLALSCFILVQSTSAQDRALETTPDLDVLVSFEQGISDFRTAVVRYREDRSALQRRFDTPMSTIGFDRMASFYADWARALAATDYDGLNHEGKIDYILLRNRIEFEQEMQRQERETVEALEPLLPYLAEVLALREAWRDRQPVDAPAAADLLNNAASYADGLATAIGNGERVDGIDTVLALRAAQYLRAVKRSMSQWFGYYNGYDPLFTWWVPEPWKRFGTALDEHALAIETAWIGDLENGPVVGNPIGEEGLKAHLKHEMIPYTADELIQIAEAEFVWMEQALIEASREMGYGDDWKAAQEAVKNLAVDPGAKPDVVVELERQSIDFLNEHDWITLPSLASEVWRMTMMSAERQRVSPFFLGGETIWISYPTNEMTHDEKLMSMRGNNPHFNRATVHHELIPGHHLQGFMTSRFNEHRGMFNTPFWGEGWALYWEMVLWDAGFPRGPEDEIGMLFWRMHRAARIIFSLSFHLERMTAQEAVDFLVDRVGHERANAEAEVRRSFQGGYSPLYQVAYMMGGIQFRELYKELVDSGQMTAREFHDAVMKGGRMPVEMVRARLTNHDLERDHQTSWRFMQ